MYTMQQQRSIAESSCRVQCLGPCRSVQKVGRAIHFDSDGVRLAILALALGHNVKVNWQCLYLVLLHHREPHQLERAVYLLLHAHHAAY